VIRNIGLLLSGMLEKPILDADTIVADNGKITAIGRAKDERPSRHGFGS
jgi:enamidase